MTGTPQISNPTLLKADWTDYQLLDLQWPKTRAIWQPDG